MKPERGQRVTFADGVVGTVKGVYPGQVKMELRDPETGRVRVQTFSMKEWESWAAKPSVQRDPMCKGGCYMFAPGTREASACEVNCRMAKNKGLASDREVAVWDGAAWERKDFNSVKKGDKFAMFEPDGALAGYWEAGSDPYLAGETWSLDAAPLAEDPSGGTPIPVKADAQA